MNERNAMRESSFMHETCIDVVMEWLINIERVTETN